MTAQSVSEVVLRQFRRASDAEAPDARRAVSRLSRTVTAGLVVLVAATWPLWTPQAAFPGVPFIGLLRGTPAGLEWAGLALAVFALLALLAGSGRRTGRGALLISAAALDGPDILRPARLSRGLINYCFWRSFWHFCPGESSPGREPWWRASIFIRPSPSSIGHFLSQAEAKWSTGC